MEVSFRANGCLTKNNSGGGRPSYENAVKSKSRNSNLELLRILSMILIIAHHYSVHGGFSLADSALTINKVLVQILSLGGKIGVICFVLITGYFMITSTFKFKKLLKLVLEVLVYSIGIMIVFYLFGLADFNFKEFGRCIMPVTHSAYWFATTYVALYILTPFINKFIGVLSQKEYLGLLFVFFILSSIVPTFLLGSFGIGNVGLFIFFYMISAYIRLYPLSFKGLFENLKVGVFLSVVSLGSLILSVIVFDFMGLLHPIFSNHATYFMSITSPLAILCAISLFLLFKNLQIKGSKFINQIALSMFGVYLIHDNLFVRPFLWHQLFQNASYIDSSLLFLHALLAISLVFVISTVIDQIRIIVFEKPLFKMIDKFENRYASSLNRLKLSIVGFVDRYIL
ncbi:MAG: acyltransferase family protein [Methanocorpusculum sp.]|nr:acyltransferase family protein [Methanocorpusculum sp.]MBR5450494.1 acyltransferase family protein [Methanocorpusculum sp.]